MKKELQNKLFVRYPELFKQKDLPMAQTCMCWGIETGDGWYGLIDHMCAEIMDCCKQYHYEIPEFIQVKEKFGGLRVYTAYTTPEIDKIITEYEGISETVCEICGEKGVLPESHGAWISTLCKECRK